MGDQLAFHLLGSVSITLDGEPLTGLRSRTATALLIYLVFQKRPLSREFLADFLWDERTPQQATANLRAILSLMRKKLTPYLHITPKTVAFNHDANYWLDVLEFEQLVETTRLKTTRLKTTLNLYQGDFLTGFHLSESRGFEEWSLTTRERLRLLAAAGLRRLVQHYLDNGEYEAGLKFGEKQLALNPLDETAQRQMMWLQARSGHRSAALQQYETCRHLLAAELGVEPAQATTAVYQRLLATSIPPPHRLPTTSTPFVGRTTELSDLAHLLAAPENRLISILGPGGIGKTRLAIEIARAIVAQRPGQFLDGVYFIPLAAVPTADALATTLAAALDYTFQGDEATMAQLVRYLREQEMLLVLDEFEHLTTPPGQEALATLLAQAAGVKLLLTSRTRLQLYGEIVVELAGLDYPSPESQTPPERFSAVQLFLRQAGRVRPGFVPDTAEMAAVAALCRLVGGMPLALELAAGGIRYFPCQEVLRQLQERLDWEYGRFPNHPARHQNMHAVFEHSWSLFSPPEQATARRLAVFRGSFDAEAIQAITGATARQIMLLSDNSFLQHDESSHFTLHPLLHQYLAEKLAQSSQEEAETLAQHTAYYSDLMFAGNRQVNIEQRYHELASLLVRHGENVTAATLWIARQPDFLDRKLDKFISLLNFYFNRSHRFEEWKIVFRQLQAALQENDSQVVAKSWLTTVLESRIALADIYLHAYRRAQTRLETILPQTRRLENGALISACLNMLGIIALRRGEFTTAWDDGEKAVTAVAGYGPHYHFPVHRFLVEVALAAHWPDKAERANEQAYQLALAVDSQAEAESVFEMNRGRIAQARGQLAAARAHLEKALPLARAKDEPKESFNVFLALSETLLELGQRETAAYHLAEALQISETVADSRMRAQAALAQGHLAALQADWAAARTWYEQSKTLFTQIRDEANRPWALAHLGVAWAQLGEAGIAVTYLQQALVMFQAWDHGPGQSLVRVGLALAHQAKDDE